MGGLRLSLLGAPRVERDGVVVGFDTRKATALLAFLALTARPQSRDALARLLWPRQDPEHARGSLRRTLSTLKKGLGPGALEITRGSIAVDDGAELAVDVLRFRSLLDRPELAEEALTEAVDLHRGDFMDGFTLRDSVEFEDWQLGEADQLRRELSGALERLAGACVSRGDYAKAIVHVSRQLALDPLQESAHRDLIRLYAWNGERASALAQYRECVRALSRELGVTPLTETTRLYQEVNEGSTAPPGAARDGETPRKDSISAKGSAAHVPAMVGRSGEWDALVKAHAAVGGAGRLVTIEGEAGIGKTRLAEGFLAGARARGAPTAAVRCYEEEISLAYQPLVEALRNVLGDVAEAGRLDDVPERWLTEAGRLVPEVAQLRPSVPLAPPLEGPGARGLFFEGVRQALGTAAADGLPAPVLLFDDVHWSDEASLDVLTYLVRRLEGWPLCLVLTWRTERVRRGSRLRRLLADAQREGTGTRLVLDRLGEADVIELVRAQAPRQAEGSAEFARRLFQESEGLPFFLVEYLAAAAQAVPDVEPDWVLPGGARELLRLRVEALSETARQVFATAAVIGRSFALETLRTASGRGEEETAAAIEELLVHGFVEELQATEGPRYDFNHERVRALVYEETSLARRRLLHRRVAEALSTGPRASARGASSAAAAHHWRLGGDDAQAARHHRAAGEHARALYANAEALEHFRAALALGHPDTPALHKAIGDLQTLNGDYDAALVSYETAAAESTGGVLAALEHRLANVYHRRGDWELADSHFEAAMGAMGEREGPKVARVLADRSLTAHQRGQGERATELARQARETAEAAGDEGALAQAHNILGVVASAARDFDGAERELEQSLSFAERANDGGARVAALNNLALTLRAKGDLDGALALTEEALDLCVRQGDRHRAAALHNNKADLLHALERPGDAMSQLKEAVVIFADVGALGGEMAPEIWKLREW